MRRVLLAAFMLTLTVSSLAAQEKKDNFNFDGDRFLAGRTPVHNTEGVDDLFMAGETVRSERAIIGSAHMAGRDVILNGAVGGDVYLAGMDISLNGIVSGDATVSGYKVEIGEVVGDLRVAGGNLVISGPVSGYALVAGADVRIESVIKGDVSLIAEEVHFADGAQIDGTLTLYEEQAGEVEVPAHVVSEDRLERRNISEWSEAAHDRNDGDWRSALTEILTGVAVIGGMILLIAAFTPEKLANVRRSIIDRPFRNLWFGLLAGSVILGSTIILILTLYGLLLAPITLLIALISVFAGYAVSAYAIGFKLLVVTRRSEPNSVGSKTLAAVVGALVVGLIALIPYVGWLFVLAFVFTGVGSIAVLMFRPKFFATA